MRNDQNYFEYELLRLPMVVFNKPSIVLPIVYLSSSELSDEEIQQLNKDLWAKEKYNNTTAKLMHHQEPYLDAIKEKSSVRVFKTYLTIYRICFIDGFNEAKVYLKDRDHEYVVKVIDGSFICVSISEIQE